jgi:hypothetical protein
MSFVNRYRACLSCPSRAIMGRDYCWRCKQQRERQQKSEQRRKAGIRPRYESAHVIDMLYLRAVWAKNPAKAQRLLARMGRAA